MPVSAATNRLVWVRAGGVCSFSDCRVELATGAEDGSGLALGKVAHIVAASTNGPRGSKALPGGDRHGFANLMLLCPTCHEIADQEVATFTVERLVGIKEAHEAWVRAQLAPKRSGRVERHHEEELVHSTLLPVQTMPPRVFSAPSVFEERDVKPRLLAPPAGEMLPFIVRESRVFTFWDLTADLGPFTDVVDKGGEIVEQSARDWWRDQDLARWYVTLLNRSLNKLTGRLGLNLDRDHDRYFFEPDFDEDGQPLPVERNYRALNRDQVSRTVVWQPVRRKTGESKNFWIHLAVSLRFHRVGGEEWVLSVRPERRFTRDGVVPLVPKATGRKSTSAKAHMYNYDVLAEVQFWRDFLSRGSPFIEFDFGAQNLIVDSASLSATVAWPGIPGDVKPFGNIYADFDLFSAKRYHDIVNKNRRPEAELELWELEDLDDLERGDS